MAGFNPDMSLEDEIEYYERQRKARGIRKRPVNGHSGGRRSVKYVSPGHTQVNYAHRILDIKFKQSPEEFKAAQMARRRRGLKRASATRKKGGRQYATADGRIVNARGKDVTDRARRTKERYDTEERHRKLQTDSYTIEDMRAMLRDDHWEEVSGHKRWNYDRNSTIKEFKKYLARNKGVY